MLVLITGGARSGKSGFAERYAASLGKCGYYVATSQVRDEEMAERVARHQATRMLSGFSWENIEESIGLADALDQLAAGNLSAAGTGAEPLAVQPVALVDCLTLWLTNVLLAAGPEEDGWDRKAERLQAARVADAAVDQLLLTLKRMPFPVLLVTNEVGGGIVPEYPLGRLFRDLAGRMNQRLAAVCDEVFLVTAGIPVELKRLAFSLPLPHSAGESGGEAAFTEEG